MPPPPVQSIGRNSPEVYVHTAADEAFEERWDRMLDLLAGGEDAVAVHESEWVLLIQKNGQLTLDNTGEILSPHYRHYISANVRPNLRHSESWPRRSNMASAPPKLAPLGLLTERE